MGKGKEVKKSLCYWATTKHRRKVPGGPNSEAMTLFGANNANGLD